MYQTPSELREEGKRERERERGREREREGEGEREGTRMSQVGRSSKNIGQDDDITERETKQNTLLQTMV